MSAHKKHMGLLTAQEKRVLELIVEAKATKRWLQHWALAHPP